MSSDLAPTSEIRADWREEAACHEASNGAPLLSTAWIDENHPLRDYAEEICDTCPVKFLCAISAVKDPEAEGLRAGAYFSNGRVPTNEAQKLVGLGLKVATRQRTRARKIAV